MKGSLDSTALVFPNMSDAIAFYKVVDVYPILITSEESLVEVSKSIQRAANGEYGYIGGLDIDRWRDGTIEIERFRPNIVIQGAGVPFIEEFVKEFAVIPEPTENHGETRRENIITVIAKCARCLIPNVDPETGLRDAAVPYKIMTKTHKDERRRNKPIFGVHGMYGGNGVVRVGDCVQVRIWAGESEE
ncbi:hypothetical protein ABKN59_011788 [Abortiporus biennis]